MQILNHRLDKFGTAALRIEILIPQDQLPAMLSGTLRRSPKCARMAEMEETCGRRREAAAVRPRDVS